MKYAIVNGIIHTGDEIVNKGAVVIENGITIAVQTEIPCDCQIIDLKGKHLSAGFIDIQINGGEKQYFSQSPTQETIQDIYEASLEYGTTHILPCLISSSNETIFQGIESIRNYREKYNNGVLGMHLEGPFLNPLKRGAHSADQVRKPTNLELEEIIRYGKDVIKLITIAPECFTNEQLEMPIESGILISIGHTTITYDEAQFYFSKGIKLVTHLFNAMTQLGHRDPGLVGAIFENESIYAPIILDGAHCNYAAARIAHKLKKEKLFLITDATFLGRKIENFKWGNFDAYLENGLYKNSEGNLAGASISMQEAVINGVTHLNLTLDEALKMATCRVSAAIQMENEIGKIKKGYPAKMVSFNEDLSQMQTLLL